MVRQFLVLPLERVDGVSACEWEALRPLLRRNSSKSCNPRLVGGKGGAANVSSLGARLSNG